MKKVCDICGGSGQVGHFGGESRFIITWDECPECLGTGIYSATGPESTSVDEPFPPTPDLPKNSTDQ